MCICPDKTTQIEAGGQPLLGRPLNKKELARIPNMVEFEENNWEYYENKFFKGEKDKDKVNCKH